MNNLKINDDGTITIPHSMLANIGIHDLSVVEYVYVQGKLMIQKVYCSQCGKELFLRTLNHQVECMNCGNIYELNYRIKDNEYEESHYRTRSGVFTFF